MTWHRFSTNPEAIDDIYGEAPPALRGCWFSGFHLDERRGGSLVVGVSIKQMPEAHRWPKDWWKESNRVSFALRLFRLSAVRIEGWSMDNVADVDVRRADDRQSVELKLSGTWGYVVATGAAMQIDVSAGKSLQGPENPYGH